MELSEALFVKYGGKIATDSSVKNVQRIPNKIGAKYTQMRIAHAHKNQNLKLRFGLDDFLAGVVSAGLADPVREIEFTAL